MKNLFDKISVDLSKNITKTYSTSFSLGILVLKPQLRDAIYSIYGYVRLADEIVDSFHDYDRKGLLDRLREETDYALLEKISLNPVLNSFQKAVHRYNIDRQLIEQFLHSMEMDLNPITYSKETYEEYILGSAEVVGLMCLHVFVEGNLEKFEKLKPYAMSLGSAFQKVNFLRDLNDDYHILGRTYFPNVDLAIFDNNTKKAIEKEIDLEFKEALIGIKKLPTSSRFGVYLAYKYYISLFNKIKRTDADTILNQRIRIPNGKKITLMMSSYVQYKMELL